MKKKVTISELVNCKKSVDFHDLLQKGCREVGLGNICPRVYATINGNPLRINEQEIYYLMYMARKAAECSDEAFEEFTEKVIVYSSYYSPEEDPDCHAMIFRKDGKFANSFTCKLLGKTLSHFFLYHIL